MSRCATLLPLSCAALLSLAPARAAPWTRLGPDGGRVTALAAAPSNRQTLYAGGAAVFRSTDGGLHWSAAADVFPASGPESPPPRISALAVSPLDPLRVLAASTHGLFISGNGGDSWARVPAIAGPVATLAFNGANAVASGPSAVYRSRDGGGTWQSASAPAMAAICEDPQKASGFFAALKQPDALGRSLYASADGLVWSPLPLTDLAPVAIRPAPDGSVLYAAVRGAGGGVFRVPRDGSAATRLSAYPSIAVAVRSDWPGILFSASEPADGVRPVYATADDGATWRAMQRDFGTRAPLTLAIGPTADALAGTDGAGVLLSDADGNWRPQRVGLKMASVSGAWRSPTGDVLLVATLEGLYRSANDGQTWTRIRNAGRRSVLTVAPAKPGRVWYIGEQGLERSDDYGHTWLVQQVGLPAGADVARLTPHPTKAEVAYAVLANGAVYRTTTGLTSWRLLLPAFTAPPPTPPAFALAPSAPGTAYAVRADGLYASENGGDTWARASAAPADALLAVDPAGPATLYRAETAGTTVWVRKSTDGGRNWETLRQEAGAAGSGFAATFLAADARRAGLLMLGTTHGMRVSENGGGVWRTPDLGVPGAWPTAWAPGGGESHLLATDGHGVLRGTLEAPVARVSDLATAVAIMRLCDVVPTPADIAFADRNGDGRITRADVALTLHIALGGR